MALLPRAFVPLLAALVAAPTAAAQFSDFSGWTGWDLGQPGQVQFAQDFVTADLDGDGHLDLAVVSWGLAQHKLAILRNLGDETFGPATFLPLLKGSAALVAADLDGDGDLDLAVTEGANDHSGNTVALFRNGGAADFTLSQRLTVPTGPHGIAAGDVDGDGDLDLATAITGISYTGTQVKLLVNDGQGGFSVGSSLGVKPGPSAIAAADLDGNGRADLVVAHEQKDVLEVLRATPSGFAAPLVFDVSADTAGGAHLFAAVALVDLDLDGDLDIAFSDNTHQKFVPLLRGIVTTVRNLGGGAFALGPDIVLRPGSGGLTDLAFADLNADGWPDVLGVNHMTWDYALSDGAGGYVQPTELNYGFLATDEPTAIGAFDADRDGDLDALVLGSHSIAFSVHRFQDGAPIEGASFAGPDGDLDAADIDGDGDLDIAGGGLGFISVVRNLGDGSFGPPDQYNSGAFGGPKGVRLRDLNGDARPDLVIGTLSGFNTRLNQGDGSFGAQVQWNLPICGLDEIDLADLDGDGDLDVILPEALGCPGVPQPRVFLVAGNGDGTFAQPAGPAFLSAGLTGAVTHTDANLDGIPDIVLGQNSWLDVYLGHGDLGFDAPISVPADFAPHGIVAADFNGDGLPDLASCNWGNAADGIDESLTVMLGFGDGHYGAPQLLPAGFSWDLGSAVSIVAGDIDRDGDTDLAIANFDSHDVSLYRNTGEGTFLPQVRVGGALSLTDLVLADFTGDGINDLVLAGQPAPLKPAGLVLLEGLGNDPWIDVAPPLAGSDGLPHLAVDGALVEGATLSARIDKARPAAAGAWIAGLSAAIVPFKGGLLAPSPDLLLPFVADAQGTTMVAAPIPVALPSGTQLVLQGWVLDPGAVAGYAATNGVRANAP